MGGAVHTSHFTPCVRFDLNLITEELHALAVACSGLMRLATIAILVCLTPTICALQITMLAKKGGGKKKGGGGNQKQSGFAWASNFELKPFESSELRALADTVAHAHQSRSGTPMHALFTSLPCTGHRPERSDWRDGAHTGCA